MFRLGLRLALRSGREAFIRLVLTVAAVAAGVTILLAVFADFHAFQATSRTPSWAATRPMSPKSADPSRTELWNYSASIYKGQVIKQVDIAALGPHAPIPAGITKLPASGRYYVSPALATLLRTAPRDELGARFHGSQVGTIGDQALTGPNQLAIIVGYSPAQLARVPGTIRVDRISTAPAVNGTTNLYRLAFGIGAIALLFPLLILISTASRLSASRREERYAAMRLVGATPRQITLIATADAIAGATLGALVGVAVFTLVRPAIADISLSGARFFPSEVTPTIWGYLGMIVIVPLAAAMTSFLSLRRVKVSPLGVARRVRRPAPTVWRVLPLLIGIPLFVLPIALSPHPTDTGPGGGSGGPAPGPAPLGLLLIMVGLVVGGPWLTMQAARLLARLSRGTSSLLAARRLADNPATAFRAIAGLVLAVFVATAVGVFGTTVSAAQRRTAVDTELSNVLRVDAGGHGAALVKQLRRFPGVQILPIYSLPPPTRRPSPRRRRLPSGGKNLASGIGDDSVISCRSLRLLPVLGHCAPGLTAVSADATVLDTDNPLVLNRDLPLVTTRNRASAANVGRLQSSLLVKTNDPDTLERVRTLLATDRASSTDGIAPETFGESAQVRNNDVTNIERVVFFAVALTLLVAGCSLAVTVGSSVVDRKRPFTLLRLSGTPRLVLAKVVLLEAVLPLVVAAVVAAATGVGVAIPVVNALVPKGIHAMLPSQGYFLSMALGLTVAIAVVLVTLPLLSRLTEPNNARFE